MGEEGGREAIRIRIDKASDTNRSPGKKMWQQELLQEKTSRRGW